MKYKIEIWRNHWIVEIFESNSIKEVLKWYKKEWQHTYDMGACTFYLYKYDKELSFSEKENFGFYD